MVEKHPYPKILSYLMKNDKILPFCRKVKEEFLDFKFKVEGGKVHYSIPQSSVHEELKTEDSIEKAITFSDDRMIRYLNKECVVVEGSKIYFKYSLGMLDKFRAAFAAEGGVYQAESFG